MVIYSSLSVLPSLIGPRRNPLGAHGGLGRAAARGLLPAIGCEGGGPRHGRRAQGPLRVVVEEELVLLAYAQEGGARSQDRRGLRAQVVLRARARQRLEVVLEV